MNANGHEPAKQWASWWARDIIEDEHCTLTAVARSLLLLLASHVDRFSNCSPSVELLARGLGIKKRAVQYARAELVAAGLIRVFPGGHGPRTTNGYWLAVRGIAPIARPVSVKGAPGCTLTPSTRVHDSAPLVIHKGAPDDALRVHPGAPEVDSEVSRERARVDSPPLTTKRGKKLLRDGVTDWGAP